MPYLQQGQRQQTVACQWICSSSLAPTSRRHAAAAIWTAWSRLVCCGTCASCAGRANYNTPNIYALQRNTRHESIGKLLFCENSSICRSRNCAKHQQRHAALPETHWQLSMPCIATHKMRHETWDTVTEEVDIVQSKGKNALPLHKYRHLCFMLVLWQVLGGFFFGLTNLFNQLELIGESYLLLCVPSWTVWACLACVL